MRPYEYVKKTMFNIKLCILMLMIPVLLIGCLAGYGRLGYNREVNRIFENYEVLADHKYYYSGSEYNPDAIIGIHRDYTLDSSLWWEADINAQQLKRWVTTMKDKSYKFPESPDGYYILDPEGKKIGLYYTPWNPGPVKMLGDNRVSVFLPDDEDKRDNDRDNVPRFN